MSNISKNKYKVIANNSQKIGIYKCNKPKEAFYKGLKKINYDRSIVKMSVIDNNTKKVYGPYYTKNYIDNFEQNGGLYTKMPRIYKFLVEVLKGNGIGEGSSDEKIKDNFLKGNYNDLLKNDSIKFKNIYRDFHIKLNKEYSCINESEYSELVTDHFKYNNIFLKCLKEKSTKSTFGLTRQSNERYFLIVDILNKFILDIVLLRRQTLIDYIQSKIKSSTEKNLNIYLEIYSEFKKTNNTDIVHYLNKYINTNLNDKNNSDINKFIQNFFYCIENFINLENYNYNFLELLFGKFYQNLKFNDVNIYIDDVNIDDLRKEYNFDNLTLWKIDQRLYEGGAITTYLIYKLLFIDMNKEDVKNELLSYKLYETSNNNKIIIERKEEIKKFFQNLDDDPINIFNMIINTFSESKLKYSDYLSSLYFFNKSNLIKNEIILNNITKNTNLKTNIKKIIIEKENQNMKNIENIEKYFQFINNEKSNIILKTKVDEIFSYLNYYLNQVLIQYFNQQNLIFFFNAYYTLFNLVHLYYHEKIDKLNDFEKTIGIRIKEKRQYEYEEIFNELSFNEIQPFNIKYLDLKKRDENKINDLNTNNPKLYIQSYDTLKYIFKILSNKTNILVPKTNIIEIKMNEIIKNVLEKLSKLDEYFDLIKNNLKFYIIFNKDFKKEKLDINNVLLKINQNLNNQSNYLIYLDILNLINIYKDYFNYNIPFFKNILVNILKNINNEFIKNNFKNILKTKSYKLYFVRHGFSCANMYKELKDKKSQTTIRDPNLTYHGINKSFEVGEEFQKNGIIIDGYYVTPLIRTWQTAYSFLNGIESYDFTVAPFSKEKTAPGAGLIGRNKDNKPYGFQYNKERFKCFLINSQLKNNKNVFIKLDNDLDEYTKDYFKDGNPKKLINYFNNNPNIIHNKNYMFFGHSHVLQSFIKKNKNIIFKKDGRQYEERELEEMLDYHENKDSVLNKNNYIWEITIENNNIVKIMLINEGKSKPNKQDININDEKLCEGTPNYICNNLQTNEEIYTGNQIHISQNQIAAIEETKSWIN